MTPEEAQAIHIQEGPLMGRKCLSCSNKASVRFRIFVPPDEFFRRSPNAAAKMAADNGGGLPTVRMRDGQRMTLVSDNGFCSHCLKDAEIAAARGPSWAVVEIDRGPNPQRSVQI
jgi:hypothetical protein